MAKRKGTKPTETEIQYTVDREQLGIFHIAASDESRPVLASVAAKNGKLYAADGFIAASIEAPGFTNDEPILMSAKDLQQLRQRTSEKEPTATMEPHKGGDYLATGAAKYKQPVVVERIDGTFPDIEQLYSREEPKAVAYLNAGLLKKVLSWIGPVAEGEVLQFRYFGETTAVEIRAYTNGGHKIRVIQMPMVHVDDGDNPKAQWFRDGLTENAELPEGERDHRRRLAHTRTASLPKGHAAALVETATQTAG